MSWLKKGLLGLLALLLISYLSVAISIYSYSKHTSQQPGDAAIVLGAAVWSDRPSPVFKERINHAVNLYHTGGVNKLIFTGGLAQGDQLAEAEAARQYALKQGVPSRDIFIETQSRTTCGNMLQAKKILDKNQLDEVLVVSDPLHMKRSMLLAKQAGINAYPSPTPTSRYQSFSTNAEFLFREIYFYSSYLLGVHQCH